MFSKKEKEVWRDSSVNRLLHKHKVLGSDPTATQKLSVVGHIYNPSVGKVETKQIPYSL